MIHYCGLGNLNALDNVDTSVIQLIMRNQPYNYPEIKLFGSI